MPFSLARPVLLVFAVAFASIFTVAVSVWAQLPADPEVGDPYPLAKCVVREAPLDETAETVFDAERDLRVCCLGCVGEFEQAYAMWIELVDERILDQQRPVYPLKECVVDGKPLDDFAEDVVFRNRLFRLCCTDCQEELKRHPAKYFEKLNKAVIARQKAGYPLKTCLVSGQPLGPNAVDYVVANRLIRLADAKQIAKFDETPWKYLAKLAEAAKQRE